ncbi:MAG: hypothetical protein WCE23_06940 [Candidatus Binatus sp.]|uniref:hypothetical protein n=1 Tax=Candidatus Binatus sp. TaxID=2811406 RepID=UPI003C786D63
MVDIDKLRKEASAKGQILRITFFPDVDSVTDVDALYDTDDRIQVEFLPKSPIHLKTQ